MLDDAIIKTPWWKRTGRLALKLRNILSCVVAAALIFHSPAHAQGISLIRDAEIEHTLRLYADPVFRTAGLAPESVKIFLVNSDSVNAFVAGGQNIFIHTGLIDACETPDMLLAVIAHETGHIVGGHLARGTEKLKNAQLGTIIGFVAGIAAAAAGGGGDAAAAVIGGSQSVIHRNLLAFSRTNEQSADQLALKYLDSLGISASGMAATFTVLRRGEMRQFGSPDPYALTHPLSRERIEYVRAHIENSPIPEGTYPKKYDEAHKRMRAKLYAFLQLPPKTFARYPQTDNSDAARMARAIAWYKIPELEKSLAEMNALLKRHPNDAYLYDLKGQILFENGRVPEALSAYTQASKLAPKEPLILVALAEAQLAGGGNAQLLQTIATLERVTQLDSTHPRAWRLLATAYGKKGEKGRAALALAEEALLNDQPDTARIQAELARKSLPAASPSALRVEDILRSAKAMKDAEKQ